MRFVRIASWHVIAMTFRGGAVKTRCGRGPLTIDGTLAGGGTKVHLTSETLPLGEPSCEICTRLVIHDQDVPA